MEFQFFKYLCYDISEKIMHKLNGWIAISVNLALSIQRNQIHIIDLYLIIE